MSFYNYKTKVIAVINQKGGVGKTTTTANLGYMLAQAGRDVLLIDFDPQASLSYYFNVGQDGEDDYLSIADLAIKQLREGKADAVYTDMTLGELAKETIVKPTYVTGEIRNVDGRREYVPVNVEFGIDLVPGHLLLSDYELELSASYSTGSKAFGLTNVITAILEEHEYDYVLIDCNPSLGILAMNAVVAAIDGVLIPTNLDVLSTKGVGSLIERVVEAQLLLKEKFNVEHMGVIGIVLNLYSERRKVDATMKVDMEKFYPFRVFSTRIPDSVNAKKAVLSGITYAQIYKKAENAYADLVKEFEERLEEMQEEGQKVVRLGGCMNREVEQGSFEEED